MPDIYVTDSTLSEAVFWWVIAVAVMAGVAWFVDYVKKGGR